MADNPVNDIGTEQTTSMMISIPEALTAAAGHKLQKGVYRKGNRVLVSQLDSYFLRSKPSQSTEVQQQDKNHSLQNIKK